MNLKRWAAAQGVSYNTARRWCLAGKLPVPLVVLRDPTASPIVMARRGRFARFGAGNVEVALWVAACTLLVMDRAEVDDDVMRGVTEILTSLCVRLYGRRRAAANWAARAVAAATAGVPS